MRTTEDNNFTVLRLGLALMVVLGHFKALVGVFAARQAGRNSLSFWSNFGFNMQHFVFSRPFINRMLQLGPFFQGPFPDFYTANAAMLLADRIAVIAEPLVIIGVTSKSYGYFHNNSKEKGGIALLQAGHDPAASQGIRDQC